jgi:dihydropteroate synthase type 2
VKTSPKVVGIVNITEDSFSDGGRFLAPLAAVRHAQALAEAGADWLELGPASSHPDAIRVSASNQIERLAPVVEALSKGPLPLSIDATDPEVLIWALELSDQGGGSIAMVNDVRGFPDPDTHARLSNAGALVVVVHSLLAQERATRDHATPNQVLDSIDRFFETRLAELVRAGVSEDRLIVDPGMGFFLGRDATASIAVLQRIPELRARFGRPVFISVSRKSFLRAISGRDVKDVGAATLAAELYAAREGAAFLRTHDVASLRDGLAVSAALHEKL